jgi:integrase
MSNRTKVKLLTVLNGILARARRVHRLPLNPMADGYLDASALARRYRAALKRAELRPLRFHDLRHTFGTRMIAKADIRRVQEWMGHADVATTMKYLYYVERPDGARLVAEHPRSTMSSPQERENRVGGRSRSVIGRSSGDL